MKRLSLICIVAITLWLDAASLLAQSEKVSVRQAPRPNQTVQLTMTQEMDFEMSFEGAAVPAVPGPMKMLMRITMAMTQRTGPRREDGSVETVLLYDQIQADVSMNGQTFPENSSTEMVGKPIVITYNRDGEVVDIKGLPAAGLTDAAFKQMMGSFYGNLPMAALSVGESTTVPLEMALPLPLPGGAPVKMTGETRLRLVSIDTDAQGRSARFESTASGKMVGDFASPDGKSKMTLDFKIEGAGTMVVDLDKGVLRSNLSTSTIDGRIDIPPGVLPAASPAMTVRGTVKMTVASK